MIRAQLLALTVAFSEVVLAIEPESYEDAADRAFMMCILSTLEGAVREGSIGDLAEPVVEFARRKIAVMELLDEPPIR